MIKALSSGKVPRRKGWKGRRFETYEAEKWKSRRDLKEDMVILCRLTERLKYPSVPTRAYVNRYLDARDGCPSFASAGATHRYIADRDEYALALITAITLHLEFLMREVFDSYAGYIP